MTLTFTLSASVYFGGPESATTELLYTTIGRNIAWGTIDAALYSVPFSTTAGSRPGTDSRDFERRRDRHRGQRHACASFSPCMLPERADLVDVTAPTVETPIDAALDRRAPVQDSAAGKRRSTVPLRYQWGRSSP